MIASGPGGVRRVNLEELLYRGSIEQDSEHAEGERRSRSEEIRPEDRIHMRKVSPALYLGITGTMAASFPAIWALLDTDRSPIPVP